MVPSFFVCMLLSDVIQTGDYDLPVLHMVRRLHEEGTRRSSLVVVTSCSWLAQHLNQRGCTFIVGYEDGYENRE